MTACTPSGARGLVIAAGPADSAASCVARSFVVRWNEKGRGNRANVLRTGGSIDALEALRTGGADLAIADADVLGDAVNGQGTFEGKTVTARTIATLYTSALHLVVPASSTIRGFSQLRGRTAGMVAPGSGTELLARRALRAALLDEHVTLRPLLPAEADRAFEGGDIDALFWVDGVPSSIVVAQGHERPGIRLIPTSSVVSLLQRRHGDTLYESVKIPASAYQTRDATDTVGVSAVLVARHDVPQPVAYAIADVLFAHAAEVATACPAARGLGPDRGARSEPAALHPGAARFYRQTAPR